MRKILSILFMTCLVFFGAIGLTACGSEGSGEQPSKLNAPVVTLVGNVASWQEDSNADKFEISLSGSLSYVENTVTSKSLVDGQTFKVRAVGDGINYKTSDWSNTVTYAQNAQTGVQEPEYLGIFASLTEPQQSSGLPEALNPSPMRITAGAMSISGGYRSLEDLLEESFENQDNWLGENYPTGSSFDIYSRAGNQIYIQIWLNNPNQHTILSLKLNGVKYQVGGGLSSFFIEKSGVLYNCVYVAVTIPEQTFNSKEYVVSEIEYIEGTFINADGTDTFMNENDTIVVGLPYTAQNPQVQNYQETAVTINSCSIAFNLTDSQNLIGLSGGWLGVAVYDGFELKENKKVVVGDNALTITGLEENSQYEIIVYVYADLHDGYGVHPHGIAYMYTFTPEVLVINEIDGAIVSNEQGTGYIGAVKVSTTLNSNTAEYVKLEILDANENVVYTNYQFDGEEVVTDGILNGKNYTVCVYYKDNEYPQGKYVDRWIYVDKLVDPTADEVDYYTFVDKGIFSFEFTSYSDKYAGVDSFVVRYLDEYSARYIAEDVLYLIANPNAVNDLWNEWLALEQQWRKAEEQSEESNNLYKQMHVVYNRHQDLANVENVWENYFDKNTDENFWQAEKLKGKYFYSYSYSGTDTENVFYANGRYYVLLENISDNEWKKVEVVMQLVKNETTENDGLVEKISSPSTGGLSLKGVFNEQHYRCVEFLEGASVNGDQFTFTLNNSHDRRIGNSGDTSSSEKKQYIYRIEANGHEIYLNQNIQTYEIDQDAWIQEYIRNAKQGTLDAVSLYKKYMPDYSEQTITLDYTEVDAGKYTFLIQTRMYNKEYEEDESEDFTEVYEMEIYKQLDKPALTVEGCYGYIELPDSASKYDIRFEAYDKQNKTIALTHNDVNWDSNSQSYRFDFAYEGAKVKVKLSKLPESSGEDGGSNQTSYWYDSDWTNFVDSDATQLTAPTFTTEGYSRTVIVNSNESQQGYIEKIIYTIDDGQERTGDRIEFSSYRPGTYTIKAKVVANYMGKEAGYCDSEWATYSYTKSGSSDKK